MPVRVRSQVEVVLRMIADAFPLDPPVEWFTELPAWFQPNMKATVITDGPEAGRFAASVAQRGTFILGNGVAWSSADSPTGYRDAMQGDTVTADGTVVRTANLSANLNHVPEAATFGRAVDAMAHTGAQLARVCYVDVPGYGTVALGAAWPGLSDLQVRKMQASPLSGDWRWREEYGAYDMTGAIFVNNPGLPLPSRPVFAPYAMAAALTAHPPIVGSWHPQEEHHMTMTGPEATIPRVGGDVHIHVAAAGPAPAPVPAPGGPPDPNAPGDAPDGGGPDDPAMLTQRLNDVEARLDAIEGWIADEQLNNVDGMMASLPDPEQAAADEYAAQTAAKYTADDLKALAAKDQVFNQDDLNFPIGDCEDVSNAAAAVGRGNADPAAVKGYIVKTAQKINCVASLPQDWQDELTSGTIGG